MGDGMDIEETPKEATEESAVPPEPELPSEFEKLFKGCEENPEDFNGWVYLLQYVEQEVSTGDIHFVNAAISPKERLVHQWPVKVGLFMHQANSNICFDSLL